MVDIVDDYHVTKSARQHEEQPTVAPLLVVAQAVLEVARVEFWRCGR